MNHIKIIGSLWLAFCVCAEQIYVKINFAKIGYEKIVVSIETQNNCAYV